MNKWMIIVGIFFANFAIGQSPIGVWKNIDDTDGKEKSHIQIYEEKGVLKAKVIKLLPSAVLTKCNACKGDKKGKDIVGMEIIWDLKKEGNKWDGGQILDPKKGKVYDCQIELDGKDKLKVRGYIGVSMFGRTQTWFRVS